MRLLALNFLVLSVFSSLQQIKSRSDCTFLTLLTLSKLVLTGGCGLPLRRHRGDLQARWSDKLDRFPGGYSQHFNHCRSCPRFQWDRSWRNPGTLATSPEMTFCGMLLAAMVPRPNICGEARNIIIFFFYLHFFRIRCSSLFICQSILPLILCWISLHRVQWTFYVVWRHWTNFLDFN